MKARSQSTDQQATESWALTLRLGTICWLALITFTSTGCQGLNAFRPTRSSGPAGGQWTSFGIDALYTGRLAQAKSFFSRATQEDPNDAQAYVHLARTLRQEDDLAAAIENMQRGITLKGENDPELIAELGDLYLQAGELDTAFQEAQHALKLNPQSASAGLLQARLYLAVNQPQQALDSLHKSASSNPQDPQSDLLMADAYLRLDQPMRALSSIEHFQSRHASLPQPHAAHFLKGQVLIQLQHYGAAIESLELACQHPQATPETYLRLSQAQLLAGQPALARQTLDVAKAIYPQLQVQFDQLIAKLQFDTEQFAIR